MGQQSDCCFSVRSRPSQNMRCLLSASKAGVLHIDM